MTDTTDFCRFSPTTFADSLPRNRIIDPGIHPLWQPMPRIAGPAYPVSCPATDNLMLHAAIYRAPRGAIIVVQAGDLDYAVCGGNVCAVAQQRGITGFIIDGMIRDLAEVREMGFPVFARGVIPKPGGKARIGTLNKSITCGGVCIAPEDIIVADEEGIIAVPSQQCDTILDEAEKRATVDAAQSLTEWQAGHRQRIDCILHELGYKE